MLIGFFLKICWDEYGGRNVAFFFVLVLCVVSEILKHPRPREHKQLEPFLFERTLPRHTNLHKFAMKFESRSIKEHRFIDLLVSDRSFEKDLNVRFLLSQATTSRFFLLPVGHNLHVQNGSLRCLIMELCEGGSYYQLLHTPHQFCSATGPISLGFQEMLNCTLRFVP